MVHNDINPVYGKGKRKTELQRWYDQFLRYYIKLEEYEYWLDIIGDRNSCSTDIYHRLRDYEKVRLFYI